MLKGFDVSKLDKLIKKKFPIIYNYKFDGMVLLYGGAIRDTMMNNKVEDLDFIILSQGKDQIKDFISKYNLDYKMNSFGGYKFNYKNTEIDICTTDDLLEVARYDITLLFYDINMHYLIPCGIYNIIDKRTITEVNDSYLFFNWKILYKSIKFVQFLIKKKKVIFIKQNIFRILYIKIKKEIRKIFIKKGDNDVKRL